MVSRLDSSAVQLRPAPFPMSLNGPRATSIIGPSPTWTTKNSRNSRLWWSRTRQS